MAIATNCQTPGAKFHTHIAPCKVIIEVEFPVDIILLGEEAKLLEINLHNAVELVLRPYFSPNLAVVYPEGDMEITGNFLRDAYHSLWYRVLLDDGRYAEVIRLPDRIIGNVKHTYSQVLVTVLDKKSRELLPQDRLPQPVVAKMVKALGDISAVRALTDTPFEPFPMEWVKLHTISSNGRYGSRAYRILKKEYEQNH